MSSDRFYVVVECGWEYNDERMYKPKSSGGKPIGVYTDEKTAEKARVEKTMKILKDLSGGTRRYMNLGEYLSEDGISEFLSHRGVEILVEEGVYDSVEDAYDDWHGEQLSGIANLSEDKLRELAGELGRWSQFYEVVEVVQ